MMCLQTSAYGGKFDSLCTETDTSRNKLNKLLIRLKCYCIKYRFNLLNV